MSEPPINPGLVEWSGENPGIYLKEREEGPWVVLATFFRIVTSIHGRGHALVLLAAPGSETFDSATPNVCIADNMPLAHFLVSDFVAKFPSFSDQPGLKSMQYQALTHVSSEGDALKSYSEHIRSADLSVSMIWEDLGQPVAMKMPVELTGTRAHEMYSVLIESRRASVIVNNRKLSGILVPRTQASLRTTSAFLYFSETWVRPPTA